MDSSRIFTVFCALIIGKVGLYTNIINRNIGYGKFSQDARYGKSVESI